MGRACSTSGEKERVEDIGGKSRREETTGNTYQDVGGWTILKWILER
jgi:hypothetical protein